MKKEMNIVKDKRQVSVRIPKVFVDKYNINKKDKVEWEDKNGKLKAEVKKA